MQFENLPLQAVRLYLELLLARGGQKQLKVEA
jgi:hypothetical protein